MELFHMIDVIELLGLPPPPAERSNYNIPCPCCDTGAHKKHLNINLKKDVFCCPRCGFSGGIFDLYAQYTGIPRNKVRDALVSRLDVQGSIPKPTRNEPITVRENPLMDIDARHNTYSALLDRLSLASDHKKNLLERGLPEQEINRLGYKTTPVLGMNTLAKQLQDEGHYLNGVPGFFRREDGQWSFVTESRGILIPVRDFEGRIQGLQIRRDNVNRRKFRWISTADRPDGCKAESWVHIAGDIHEQIILIEGPMKADIVHYFTGQTVVAVAGVNAQSQLSPVLECLRKKNVRKVMTAFDMDFMRNPHVQDGYDSLTELLRNSGLDYGTYVWDANYNGLDDYIWKCCIEGQSQ